MSTIFTLEKLFKAYKDCQIGKKGTINALTFEVYRERNLIKLLSELQDRTYKISRHICFIVTHPTAREIFAADFRDRIVHHLLHNEILGIFEADFIADSYANRKGKGTHSAVEKAKKYILEVEKERKECFYLKLDIQSFFRSIDKDILDQLISEKILLGGGSISWKEEILWIARKIIYHDPTLNFFYKGAEAKKFLIPKNKSLFYSEEKGLPIGNLTSQFFANVYLNQLDHFITSELGCNRYIRYVDDFVIFDSDKEKLKSYIEPIDQYLKLKLNLRIHRNKICLQDVSKGLDFLGYFIKFSHMLVRQKVVRRFKSKLYEIKGNEKIFRDEAERALPMINSYYGHLSHANSFKLRKHIYKDHLPNGMKKFLKTDTSFKSVNLTNKPKNKNEKSS